MAPDEMSSQRIESPVRRLARLAFRIVDSLAAANEAILGVLLCGGESLRQRAGETGRDRVTGEFSHLTRLFRSALGSGLADQLIAVLNALTEDRDRIQRALIVWFDLIEVLVQDTERRHGTEPGLGKIKTVEVKQALEYFLNSGQFSLPNIPQPLATLLLDSVVEWTINVIVLQANRYDLWEVDAVLPSGLGRTWSALKRVAWTVAVNVANFCALVIRWVSRFLRPKRTMSPELKAALEAVTREGEIIHEQELIVRVSRLFIWLGSHQSELVQATELVFGAVQEAETLLEMTGPEKKEFARDLIWAVLEEMGFAPQSGIVEAMIDSAIDMLIETSVHFFNKRGGFKHRDEQDALTFA